MWLGLHFPDLGLEVFDADPALPVVLVEDQQVVASSPRAHALGIVCGGTLATARSVCAGIRHFQRDRERERKRLELLAEALYRFSSLVSIELPDGVVLEVARSRKLYSDLDILTAQAVAVARALGHEASARVAPTPAAALLLARSGAANVAQAPVAAAGLSGTQQAQLASMGMRRLGPLLELPETELGLRFGTELVDFLGRVSGRLPDPRPGISPAAQFSRELNLLDPIRDKNGLLFPMQRLLGELEIWLIGRQLGAERLRWRFAAHAPEDAVFMEVRFGQSRQRKSAFLPVTRLQLERLELPEDVVTVALEARALIPHAPGSHGLLVERPGETPIADSELLDFIDELRARLGPECCHGIASVDEHVPERAWRPVWTPAKNTERRGSLKRIRPKSPGPDGAAGASGGRALPRPTWLFDPPRRVDPSRLTLLRGPERLRTGWWRQSLTRDYYLARHDSGVCCWVFVDDEACWFLHGYFA